MKYILKHIDTGFFLKRNFSSSKIYNLPNLTPKLKVLTDDLKKARVWDCEYGAKWFMSGVGLQNQITRTNCLNELTDTIKSTGGEAAKYMGSHEHGVAAAIARSYWRPAAVQSHLIKIPKTAQPKTKEDKLKFYDVTHKEGACVKIFDTKKVVREHCRHCGVKLVQIPALRLNWQYICIICLEDMYAEMQTMKDDKWLKYVKEEKFVHAL